MNKQNPQLLLHHREVREKSTFQTRLEMQPLSCLSDPVRSHKDLDKDAALYFRKAIQFYEELSKQIVSQDKSQFDSALMMGLMFHGKAKRLVKNRKYEDAVKVPAMGEEAFSVCDLKAVEKDSFMEISFHIPNDNTQFVGDENRPPAQVLREEMM
ncbi:hypothetical protein L2E82_11959 [Cichorium intybus]|uniref:Uncharacterized protein n=1 Tax=Cichorium intybus TaxID=13427 RepID=A0ACB9GFZ1_CICIN|nr:hypothetical protein L2E82_11959 [Cichorium intybus]